VSADARVSGEWEGRAVERSTWHWIFGGDTNPAAAIDTVSESSECHEDRYKAIPRTPGPNKSTPGELEAASPEAGTTLPAIPKFLLLAVTNSGALPYPSPF